VFFGNNRLCDDIPEWKASSSTETHRLIVDFLISRFESTVLFSSFPLFLFDIYQSPDRACSPFTLNWFCGSDRKNKMKTIDWRVVRVFSFVRWYVLWCDRHHLVLMPIRVTYLKASHYSMHTES
jgi:hypothetical protein